jgi:hypothetical protein
MALNHKLLSGMASAFMDQGFKAVGLVLVTEPMPGMLKLHFVADGGESPNSQMALIEALELLTKEVVKEDRVEISNDGIVH